MHTERGIVFLILVERLVPEKSILPSNKTYVLILLHNSKESKLVL